MGSGSIVIELACFALRPIGAAAANMARGAPPPPLLLSLISETCTLAPGMARTWA